jgi:hypothetical protein
MRRQHNWWKPAAIAAAVLMTLTPPRSDASGVDSKYIPADAKWVVHVDVDAVVKSRLYNMLALDVDGLIDGKRLVVGTRAEGAPMPLASKKIQAVGDMLGLKIPEDIHGITLVGRSFSDEGVFVLVKAKMNHDHLIGVAKINPEYKSAKYDGVEVSTFGEAGSEEAAGAFLADDVIVLAQKGSEVRHAIDAAAANRKAAPGALQSAFAATNPAEGTGVSGIMVYVAADGLAELQKEEAELSPILLPVTHVRATIGERADDVVLQAVLTVKDSESARQVRGALEGVKAIATLAALSSNDPNATMVAGLASRAESTVDETSVKIDWPVSFDTLQGLAKLGEAKHGKKHKGATTQPAAVTAPAETPAVSE